MKTILYLFILTLTACAPVQTRQWQNPNLTYDQQQRDKLYCRQFGVQEAELNGFAGNMFVELLITNYQNSCLTELGYK
jgi:hypothetical protein